MTSNRWVIVALIVLSLAIAWLAPHADRRNWWTIDGDAARYTGLALYLLGGVVRLIPVFELKNRFSAFVAVQEGHQLKTDGMYRFVRHPSYAGLLISTVGLCLVFRSSIGLLLTLAMLVPIIARIRAEEAFLHEEFGSSSTVHREKLLCFRMLLEHNKSVAPGIRSQGARIRSRGRVERYATDSGRKGYPRRTEDCVTDAFGLGAQQKAFSAVLKLHFGQIVQIKLDVSPLARERFPLKTLLQSPA